MATWNVLSVLILWLQYFQHNVVAGHVAGKTVVQHFHLQA